MGSQNLTALDCSKIAEMNLILLYDTEGCGIRMLQLPSVDLRACDNAKI